MLNQTKNLSWLKRQQQQIYDEGYLLDCWIGRYTPGGTAKGTHHYFDGEGMLHAGEFRAGNFTYRNKWVRTEGWLKNTEAGEELHWGVMNSVKGSPDKPMNDVANTDVIGHGGKAVLQHVGIDRLDHVLVGLLLQGT